MKSSPFIVACGLAALMLAGCIPESQHPISRLADAEQDTRFHGVWTADEADCVRYLHVGAEVDKPARPDATEPEPGLMRFWFVTHRKEEGKSGVERPFTMRFFVSKVGDDRYANALLPFENAEPPNQFVPTKFLFFKYKIDGDRLIVWGIDFQATACVIENGELGGTVTRDGNDLKSAVLTDSSEHLRVFLSGGGDKLFPDKGKVTFRRVR